MKLKLLRQDIIFEGFLRKRDIKQIVSMNVFDNHNSLVYAIYVCSILKENEINLKTKSILCLLSRINDCSIIKITIR